MHLPLTTFSVFRNDGFGPLILLIIFLVIAYCEKHFPKATKVFAVSFFTLVMVALLITFIVFVATGVFTGGRR